MPLMIDPLRLARDLIDVPSTSGDEKQAGALVETTLRSLGFECRRQDVSEERFNLFATTGRRARVILCSHLDTVPPFFPSREDEASIYGRGACDTKGIIAAMIAAGQQLLEAGVGDFGFLFVVGEETDSIGAKVANEVMAGVGSEFVVVGEPTESRYVRASKGSCTCTIGFRGVAAHSAYPERGDSAIVKMMRAIERIYATGWGEHPILGRATANVGVVRGGAKANIIPAEAEADMLFRTVEPPAAVVERLREVIAPFDGEVLGWYGNDPTFMAVPPGADAVVVGFNTDIPHLSNLGTPLLFGPGSILDAHGSNERIGKKELLDAVGVYVALVRDLLEGRITADANR